VCLFVEAIYRSARTTPRETTTAARRRTRAFDTEAVRLETDVTLEQVFAEGRQVAPPMPALDVPEAVAASDQAAIEAAQEARGALLAKSRPPGQGVGADQQHTVHAMDLARVNASSLGCKQCCSAIYADWKLPCLNG
jgi:hypothetical protein